MTEGREFFPSWDSHTTVQCTSHKWTLNLSSLPQGTFPLPSCVKLVSRWTQGFLSLWHLLGWGWLADGGACTAYGWCHLNVPVQQAPSACSSHFHSLTNNNFRTKYTSLGQLNNPLSLLSPPLNLRFDQISWAMSLLNEWMVEWKNWST